MLSLLRSNPLDAGSATMHEHHALYFARALLLLTLGLRPNTSYQWRASRMSA